MKFDKTTTMTNISDNEDYIDRLAQVLPWHRSLTAHERLGIIFIAVTFVLMVTCMLICFVWSQSPLRRRYFSKKQRDLEQHILIPRTTRSVTVGEYPILPPYEMKERRSGSHSASSSVSTTGSYAGRPTLYDSSVYPEIHIRLDIDVKGQNLIVRLTDGKNFLPHPAFNGNAEFLIHVQLLKNKILRKFQDEKRKKESSLQLSIWKQQQEKTTRKLPRTSLDTLECNESLLFELHSSQVKSTTLRFLLFCVDRFGISDLVSQSLIQLDRTMIPYHNRIIEFRDVPQVAFAEVYVGLNYLPTAQKLTLKFDKLRYFCEIESDEQIDARIMVAFFHHGRRFFQKKLQSIILDRSIRRNHNIFEVKDTIVQNIPNNDIRSIYVYFDLVIRKSATKVESIMSCGSVFLGERTRNETEWLAMLEHPRQDHFKWYRFFG